MSWNFSELRKHKEPFAFDETLDLSDSLKQRFPEQVLDSSKFEFKGLATADNGSVIIDATIKGSLVVPSSRSLQPVTLPIDTMISEIYVEDGDKLDDYANDEVVIVVDHDKINITEAVEDNIILQVPMQILTPEEESKGIMPTGNEWSVISEDEESEERTQKVDPRLAKLKDLFDEDSE